MWDFTYRESFLKDLSRIQPKKTRDNIERIVFEQIPNMDNPFLYKGLKSMKGYHGFYKIRVGNYRIGIYANQKSKKFEFCRILLRKDIYRYFP